MLIFIDIETTGVDRDDKICSISIMVDDKIEYELINDGKKISSKASSINHITNEIIRYSPPFLDSDIYNLLESLNVAENILVAHNIKFIKDIFLHYNFEWIGEVIDTQKVTKHLISEAKEFSLQFLRYELKLYRYEEMELNRLGLEDKLIAHNAKSDTIITRLLYEYLLGFSTMRDMIMLTNTNILIEKFDFGKYKGAYIEDVARDDINYLRWLMVNVDDLDEDLRYSIEKYLPMI